MTTARMGARCQVVIPKPERERAGLRPNSRVQVRAVGRTVVIHAVGISPRGIGRDLAGPGDAAGYVRALREEWAARP